MSTGQVDVAPVEPQSLASAGTGVEQEDHQWAQMIATRGYEAVRLINS